MRSSLFLGCWFLLVLECHCWVVIKFPQVKELYPKERTKYRRRWGGDPFMKKSSRELKQYCNELGSSAVYSMWSNSEKPPPPMVTITSNGVSAATQEPRELKYQYQKAVGEHDPVPMFSCLTYDGYWYLSYGFTDDYLFLFQNVGMDEKNEGPLYDVVGILEKSASLDKSMLRGNVIESALQSSLTAANQSPLPDLWDKSSQQFRLCSLVMDAVRKAYTGPKVNTINFGQDYDDQVVVRRPFMFQFSKKKDISLDAIPCAMNRTFRRPNFLVVPNSNDPDSVFVLLEKEDLVDNKTKYVTTYLVRDVSALKYWSTY